jgi:hypothetical protein
MQNLTSNAIKPLKNLPDATIEWNAVKEGDHTAPGKGTVFSLILPAVA